MSLEPEQPIAPHPEEPVTTEPVNLETLADQVLHARENRDKHDALTRLLGCGAAALPYLLEIVDRTSDDRIAARAITLGLGPLPQEAANRKLADLLDRDSRPRWKRSAARAIARFKLEPNAALVCKVLANENDVEIRRTLLDELDKKEPASLEPLSPLRAQLTAALLAEPVAELRDKLGTIIGRTGTGLERVRALLDALRNNPTRTRDNLDMAAMRLVLAPRDDDDRKTMVACILRAAVESDDPRMLGLAGTLLIQVTGGVQAAGAAINASSGMQGMDAAKVEQLRIQVGGETALSPLFRSLEEDLRTYFQEPLHRLRQETESNWQDTVNSARKGFTLRVYMSAAVFVVGLIILGLSTWKILFGGPRADIFGPGVSFVSGLGTMLLVVYTGPLKEIRKSVTDLGAANAVFIAFVHRVTEVSHAFTAKYLSDHLTSEDVKESCTLLAEAASDAIRGLREESGAKRGRTEGEAEPPRVERIRHSRAGQVHVEQPPGGVRH